MYSLKALVVVAMALLPHAYTQSLPFVIPGVASADLDGISISELGAGPSGTTYLVVPAPTDTDLGIYGSITVVANPTHVALNYDNPALGISEDEQCGVSVVGTDAEFIECTVAVAISNSATTILSTSTIGTTVTGLTLTAVPTGTGSVAPGSSGSTTAPASSSTGTPTTGSGTSSTGTNTASSGSASTTNGAGKLNLPATAASLIAVGLSALIFL